MLKAAAPKLMGERPLAATVRCCEIASGSSHVLPLPVGGDDLYKAADFTAVVGEQGRYARRSP